MNSLPAFVLASALIAATPGPGVVYVCTQAAILGRVAVLPLATGIALGDVAVLAIAGTCLHFLVAPSFLFPLRIIGGLYLLYLAFCSWRVRDPASGANDILEKNGRPLSGAFFTTATNPKTLLFFLAFFPPFIDNTRDFLPQYLLLAGLWLVVGTLNAASYAWIASLNHNMTSGNRLLFSRTGSIILGLLGTCLLLGQDFSS